MPKYPKVKISYAKITYAQQTSAQNNICTNNLRVHINSKNYILQKEHMEAIPQ